MGWVGCYSAIAYCDSCNQGVDVAQVETGEECRQILRDGGWKFRKDGTVICPTCAVSTNLTVLPVDNREGSPWQYRWEKYERRN